MKTTKVHGAVAVVLTVLVAALAAIVPNAQGQVTWEQVTNGLVSYYPLDYLTPGNTNTTPDVISRRDMWLVNMGPTNIVTGKWGYCLYFSQTPTPTVIYYNSTGQDPLTGNGDFLPFVNQRGATMNFWIKSAAAGPFGGDKRFFGEADTTGGSANPLLLIGSSSGDPSHRAHFLFRQQEPAWSGGPTRLVDGTYQLPVPGYYWAQGDHYTSNSVLDGQWHMFTMVIDTNGSAYVYVDGVYDLGRGNWTDFYGNPACLNPLPVTNFWYTTNEYPFVEPPASNPPPNGFVRWMLNATFKTGSTCFGGFKRGAPTGGDPWYIDDIAFWNRELTAEEIEFIYTNGLPNIALNTNLIEIKSFSADLAEVASGDWVRLSWEVSGATNIYISGVGNVTALGPKASTNVTLTGDQTYTFTLTAQNGIVADKQASVSVKSFRGVSSDWHLIQRFDGVFSDTQWGIDANNWVSTRSAWDGTPFDRWNVVTLNTGGAQNKVLAPRSGYASNPNSPLGFDSRGALAYGKIGPWGVAEGLTIPPNQTNTLFFRFSLREPPPFYDTNAQSYYYSDMDCVIGITDQNFIRPVYGGLGYPGNVGVFISILRNSGGIFDPGHPFDLFAIDFDGTGTANNFSYVESVDPVGLQTNVNYYVWIDIENYNTYSNYNAETGQWYTTNQAVFSVWLMKQGDTTRTQLVSRFRSNRNYVDYNPVNDFPVPYLDRVFVSIGDQSTGSAGSYFTTNMIVVDDFYLSKNGINGTIPKLFGIRAIVRGPTNAVISWDSLGSLYQTNTYTIERAFAITGPWETVATVASGGDVTTYTDNTVGTAPMAFYRIRWP